ncbi:enoyl-CoA hydratase/carnithine racemase [Leucobacter luti]|uniref:Enoyl-CoA hydratase/carnithine racemase n=1 Tax=Leucobacter luti TaxID=340320 RepID=A0A4R6S3W1_9MICO|nr:enoyl-CoA hydratase/isomerase family protein [Leucobacter luti]MCW2287142.1 enoyl-CoA hydratase [Leucobacter luti]TCK41368.1 enoyl-CoA hydratase/carnithine racemase [Leucobacter luti]TDP94342.1 enoyl-CoA hydratase/carnithine racemase [Leucobacter luti]
MSGPLLIEDRGTHVLATLDRPEKRNAIDQDLIDALHALCAELEQVPRTLVLRGAGSSFAAGADIAQLRERRAADARAGINTHAFTRVAELPMPVIAALDGFALGGGAELAYAADIRVGTPALRMGNPETGLGIIAAAGASWRLRELVGTPLATEMLLTGRVLSGDEAYAAGLITQLHDTGAEAFTAAEAIAARIAKLDPEATRASKRVLRAPASAHPEIDLAEQAILFESPEKMRRMTEFLERKKTS